ncbi:hypothetical protein [Tropicibacter sp. S64]|uniref:hypothetical protein n=1 Tax=Tropicibacter sp. S64 TaxID=3415122 RepID=UPI003C7B3DC2
MSETLGVPLRLRAIPGTDRIDACGTYPISPGLRRSDPGAIRAELAALGVVSLVLVTDPFDAPLDGFDLTRPYKPHHIINPADGPARFSKHHRAEIRRALRQCSARQIMLSDHLPAFLALYDTLAERHGFGPQHRFGVNHFRHLADHPQDFPTFGAFQSETLVSAHIWTRYENRLYSHLAASSAEGYAMSAAYAVYDASIAGFAGHRITLGGVPDSAGGQPNPGLDRFKRGFANGVASPSLCGLIVDESAYTSLSSRANTSEKTGFFPAYRA